MFVIIANFNNNVNFIMFRHLQDLVNLFQTGASDGFSCKENLKFPWQNVSSKCRDTGKLILYFFRRANTSLKMRKKKASLHFRKANSSLKLS